MNISIETLAQPVSESMPSGENLEYEPKFREMEAHSQYKSAPMVGEKEEAANEPDWKAVENLATELREKTRDLRVQVFATLACIHTSGVPGFRDNLKLLKNYLDGLWDSVHPQLDPQDDSDPTLRLSTLQMLNDHVYITLALSRVKLVQLKGLGSFGLRDVELALGREAPLKGEAVADENVIRQAFIRADPEYMASLRTALDDSIQLFADISGIWDKQTGNKEGPNFDNATKVLKRIALVMDEFMPARTANSSAGQDPDGDGMAAPAHPQQSGVINSRGDVVRVLDKVCEYYSVNEPSSPIPLLLRRAQRLVEKSFLEILEDMVPDGVQQARIVSGTTQKDG